MNTIISLIVGAVVGSIAVVGGVSAYSAASSDTSSVPRIVSGSNVTYADE